jgi:hypothetical protein
MLKRAKPFTAKYVQHNQKLVAALVKMMEEVNAGRKTFVNDGGSNEAV